MGSLCERGNNFDETEWQVASNRVHHAKEHLSYVVLPVISGRYHHQVT